MSISRRSFISASAGAVALPYTGYLTTSQLPKSLSTNRFDPWIEVDTAALRHNVLEVARLAANRPILAVVKNNAYGLGVAETSRFLETLPQIAGFAVVKTEAALSLRQAGVSKPILHMGMFAAEDLGELLNRRVQLSLYTDDALERLQPALARGVTVEAHVYVDSGMGRMGIPYHRAMPLLQKLAVADRLTLRGMYMAFAEEKDFDHEQLRRFQELAAAARAQRIDVGQLHAASSNGVFHLPEAHLDIVRPGIALYGAYPSDPDAEKQISQLKCAFRLRARVVRVERLRTGDSVSYGRNYVADRPTWIATLPVGHTDGYTRRAVQGARVLIGNATYPVIGAVSASHSIVELGEQTEVTVGDIATMVGPDVPDIEPNNLAAATGASVYDVLMHLNPTLPRVFVNG